MKRWSLVVLLAFFTTFVPGAASAQDEEVDRFALGIGFGLVDLSEPLADSSTETYLQANFRILLGDKSAQRDDKTVVAYLEPEIGYWESNNRVPLPGNSAANIDQSDLMLGLNIVGVVPFRRVDYFLGAGFSIHSFDSGGSISGVQLDEDETFGVNLQTGLDVRFSETIGVYGLLRIDLVEDVQEEQAKIALGLRFFFG